MEQVTKMSTAEMINAIVLLQQQVSELSAKVNAPKPESKEMTDEHAERVTYGDLAEKKHKDAAEVLGLTYGQIYSCRLGFTFKDVHKKAKDEGKKNAWIK